jgi:hypothetical protein
MHNMSFRPVVVVVRRVGVVITPTASG